MRLKTPDNSWHIRARAVMAQGETGTNSKRPTQYVQGVYPTHLTQGQGCYVWDAWGNRYIDFIGSLGASILGYAHPHVNEAVRKQLEKGSIFSLPSTLEVEVAEMIASFFPSMQKVRFLKTGNEATLAAVRIARAATGRQIILNEGFHGHGDLWTSMSPPAIGVKDNFIIMPYTHDIALINLAGTIVEPISLDMSQDARAHLSEVVSYTKHKSGCMIFDEIITGCRVPGMSVAKMWDFNPEITILGKAIANGFPLSIVGGHKDVMDCSEYFISSTFSGDAISLAACKATITELNTKKLDDLMYYGERLRGRLNALDKEIEFVGYGTRAALNVTNERTALFMQECCKAGLLFGKAWFYNFAHLEENIEETVMNIATDVVSRINRGEVKLEGERPQETFKR